MLGALAPFLESYKYAGLWEEVESCTLWNQGANCQCGELGCRLPSRAGLSVWVGKPPGKWS